MDAQDLLRKAAQCRRLAAGLMPGDATREQLLRLAEEFDAAVQSAASVPQRPPAEREPPTKVDPVGADPTGEGYGAF